jgi:hypothetical protein
MDRRPWDGYAAAAVVRGRVESLETGLPVEIQMVDAPPSRGPEVKSARTMSWRPSTQGVRGRRGRDRLGTAGAAVVQPGPGRP